MQKNCASSLLPQCRLCGFIGHHKINIFEEDSFLEDSSADALSEKIFRCVEVRVERGDATTDICEKCYGKIYEFARFRELCAATDRKMRTSKRRRGVIDGVNPSLEVVNETENSLNGYVSQNQGPSHDEYISLIGTDSENEGMGVSWINSTVQVTLRSAAMKRGHADVNSAVDQSPKRKKHEPECSATMMREFPDTGPNTSRCDDWSELTLGINEATNSGGAERATRASQNCDSVSKSIGSCDAFNEDETDSEEEAFTTSAQDVNWRSHNGHFSGKTKKRANNKSMKTLSYPLIKCRSRGGCRETFDNWDAMMCHMANYHAKGKKTTFCCHLCKKTSGTKQALQRHMNGVHNREIRFMCPIRSCAKIFTQKSGLKRHTNAVHTKAVAFKCQKCPMKFYRKYDLTRHLANEHGKGITFSCYLCKKQLSAKQKLQMHMNVLHTGQARSKCPFPNCSKSFTDKSNLKRHINAIHTKKNVIKCTKCDMEFYWKSNLIKHSANKH